MKAPQTADGARWQQARSASLEVLDEIARSAELENRELTSAERSRFDAARAVIERSDARLEGRDPAPGRLPFVGARIARALAVAGLSHAEQHLRAEGDVEAALLVRAAVSPATMGTPAWAGDLSSPSRMQFIEALRGRSVFARFLGDRVIDLAGAPSLKLPRAAGSTLSGGVVAEGDPVPLKVFSLDRPELSCGKISTLSLVSAELMRNAFAARVIESALLADAGVAVDQVFLGAAAASSGSTAGLFNEANALAAVSATAGANAAAAQADIKGALRAMVAANRAMAECHWLGTPELWADLAALGSPFAEAVDRGSLRGYPILQSPDAPARQLSLIDASQIIGVTDGVPRLSVSRTATLYADSAPTVAADQPVTSLFQRDLVAIKHDIFIGWGTTRTGAVAYVPTTSWSA